MRLSCPNEHGQRSEQLSTAELKARKKQKKNSSSSSISLRLGSMEAAGGECVMSLLGFMPSGLIECGGHKHESN